MAASQYKSANFRESSNTGNPLFYPAAVQLPPFLRFGTASSNMHLLRLHNQGLPLLKRDASGAHVRRLLAAACDKTRRMKPSDEDAGHRLRQRRIEGENNPMLNAADLGPVVPNEVKHPKKFVSRIVTSIVCNNTRRACMLT